MNGVHHPLIVNHFMTSIPSALSSWPMHNCCSSDLASPPLRNLASSCLAEGNLCSAAVTLHPHWISSCPLACLRARSWVLELIWQLTQKILHSTLQSSSFPQLHIWHWKNLDSTHILRNTITHSNDYYTQGSTGTKVRPWAAADYTNWLAAPQILRGRTQPSNTEHR